MGGSFRLSISVLLVISVLWKPAYSDKCSLACKGSPTAPTYLNGHKYSYGVEGTVSIFLTGADKQETSVKLLGQASVTALGNCVNELRVQNLVISGPDGKKYSSPPGVDKAVRFTLEDGRVGPEICTEPGDTRRSLNIKRAIISLLQTENKHSNQVDIFGVCPTEASSSQEGSAVLVHRTRDLSHCAHREQGKNDLVTAVYNPSAEIKDTQVLQSTLNVESKVNNGVPEKVSATEEYLYRPFSVGDNGARAKVHTKLTLTGKSGAANAPSQCTETRTIIFENPHGNKGGGNAESALAAIKDTASTLGSEASSKSAGEFAQLVRILRTVGKEELVKVFLQVKGNGLQKRVFLDGLIRAGTGYSIEASIEILKGRELSTLEQQLVFLSLGNAQHVNEETIKAATSLLDLTNIPKEIYLGVGALAGAYCRDHNCHTTKSDGVVALSQKLGAKLQNCKPKSKVEEDNVVAVLKGIRNIHHLEDSLIEKVVRCATDSSIKARVRVAALEAFGADPCAAKLKKAGLDLMKNRQLDSEIRIKSYLAVIECPCAGSANEIKNLLESEPVHQVGRFITTSLRHIKSSTNPDKILARKHYGLIRTPNKFNIDDRKYSFYREGSYNIDALGVGGNLEETVIYSQDSFLPRSASLNLTAEVFGHSLNILQVGGRQGNLDRVAEHFLGPKSFLRTEKPQNIYDNFMKRFNEAQQKFGDSLNRGRRSVKSEIDNFDKKLKADSEPYNNELDLDIYLKLFGTDAVFLSLGDDKGVDFNAFIDKFMKLVNTGVEHVKHFQQEVRAHLLFLDAELAYPTSTGFPLKLDLVGAATGRLEVATNIDLRQIYRNPKNAKLDIKLVPSTDVEICGLFLVDADVVSTGLKVVTNLHSSTGGHLIAKVLEDGNGIDLQFGLPIEKQEILTASNDLVYFVTEKGRKEKQIALKIDTDRKEYSGCFDQLSGMLGLTVCGEVSVPFSVSGPEAQASISKFIARYPLTGPSKVKLVIEKNDLKGYHIKGVLRNDYPAKQAFELLFEAEGSQNRRTSISGEWVNKPEEKSVKLSLESPIKTLYGQAGFYDKANERLILVKAKVDAEEYYAKAGFNVQGNDRRMVYKPLIEYQMPGDDGKRVLKVDGQLIREVNGPHIKYSIEGIKITIPNSSDVIDVNGHFSEEPGNLNLDIKARKGEHNLLLIGNLKGYDLNLEFQNTLNPNVNFKLSGHIENVQEVNHNDLELTYGQDLRNTNNRIIFNQLLKFHKKSNLDFNIITKNKFEIQRMPIKLIVNAEVDPKKLDVEIDGVYIDNKAEFDLEVRTQIKKQGDYSVKFTAEVDKKGIEVFAKRDIVSADKSNLENYITINKAHKYELSGVVLHKTKPNDINVGAVGHLKVSADGKNEDIKFDVGYIENANLYSSHAKISGSKFDLVDYLLKVTRGANASGQLKLILKDTVSANGQFKVTDNDGRGNGMLIVDLNKRKIKADVKFVVKNPVYNADVDVFLNYEKDNNDKLHFSTNTKRTDSLVDSKNKLDYAGKKTEVNVHLEGSIHNAGKSKANIDVILPNERCFNLKMDQDFTLTNVLNGHSEYVFSDAVKRGGPSSSIAFKSKFTDTDFDKEAINIEGQIELKLRDGKNLQNTFYLKNIPEGERYKYDFKVDTKGSLIPKPASLAASGEGSESLFDFDEKYRLKGNYGEDMAFELVGNVETKYGEKEDKKYVSDDTLTLRLPFEKAHDLKFVSHILFLLPQHKDVIAEYTFIESVQVNADVYKVDASGKAGHAEGFNKIKVLVPHVDPLVLDVSYKVDEQSDKSRLAVDIKSQYGKGKTSNVAMKAQVGPQEFGVLVQVASPQAEKLKKLDIQFISKNPTPDTYTATFGVDADGKAYNYDIYTVYSKVNPVLDVKFTYPDSQPGRVYFKGSSISSNQGKVEAKLENVREITADATVEVNVQRDNVALKAVANSEKLGWKNYKVDILSKDAGSGKRLEFQATNNGQNVFSGSTSFISKQEGPKTIVEGSGSVKVKEEQKSANFKYIRTVLTEGNEQGVETFLNLAIGERSYVAESRVTNLEYKNSYVYCEEKKQCANVDLQSKINVPRPGTLQHLVNVGFDLRKLGFAPEFGLQVSNEVSEKKLPQFTLDLHVNKEDKKYYLHAYSQPEIGKFPAGITVTLPQRVLALESFVTYPTNRALPFPVKGEVALHLDKNKPHTKTAARFLVDVTAATQQHTAVAEFGFSHPTFRGKEALVKFRGNIQQPNENSIKIESLASVSHPAYPARESKVYFEVNPTHIKLLLDTPFVKVIDLDGSAVMKENLQQGDVKFSLLQGKPVVMHAVVRDFQYYEFTTGYSDETQRKLSIVGHIDPEKRIDISADIVLSNEKKNIIHGALYLQDNLVKSDYGVSKENFKYFVTALQNDFKNLEQRIKDLGDKASNEFKQALERQTKMINQADSYTKDELSKLYKEVSNDQGLKDIAKFINDVAGFLAKFIDDIIRVTKPSIEKIDQVISETAKKIIDLYDKKIDPQVKQLYANLSAVIKEYFEGLIDLVAHFAALINDFYEKHKPELQELTNTIAEIFKDLTRLLVIQLKEIRTKLVQMCADITEQIKELPIVAMIKEKWQELTVPDQILGVIQEIHNTIRALLPTEETKNFADAVHEYIQLKLRNQKVDDSAQLRGIYEKFALALTSVVQFVRSHTNQLGLPGFFNFNALSLVSGSAQVSTPGLGEVPSVSILTQLLKGDIPDPLALIKAYRPRHLNPLDEVPAKLRAVVVNGQHIFTFDGRHLTFPGNCRYVLAHDFVDRNFTLVMQLQNGQPKVLALQDKNGATVELKDNGQVVLNGANHGFPIIDKDVYAFKETVGRIGLGSSYGIKAICSPKLEVCYIEINGFYLGKLRGLLGDGNNEPYDDFRMPNGKITNSESEFGNSYRLAGSCPQVKTPDHSHHQLHITMPAPCELVFGASSTLRPFSLLLDVAPFRQACIHAVTANSANAQKEACDLARGYTALAVTGLLPAVLPPVCLQCTDIDKPKSLGDTYEVKLPGKQADIVVSVELTKINEKNYKNLVVPLVSQLVDSLKSKHISDIKVYLAGISSTLAYPIMFDTDIKLKSAKVKFYDESRYRHTPRIQTGFEKLDKTIAEIARLVDDLRVKLGLTNVVGGYNSLLSLPLRAGAVKHHINVVGERCKSSFFAVSFLRSIAYGTLFEQMAYSHTLVTVTPDLKVGGGKNPSQIVGFTEQAVLLLGDKKQSKDSETLRSTLEYDEDDACIDFIESTDGLVLSATNYQALNPGQQKQFLQTATTAITNKVLGETLLQECTCMYSDPFIVSSVCINKERKEVGRRRK